MIADANGLSGSETLVAGQTLRIPNKAHNAHNTNDVYKVYDPNEAIGDVSPTAGTPAAKPPKKGCGIIGQILVMIVAIVVTAIIRIPVIQFFQGTALGATAGAIVGGAVVGATASVASQAFGVAAGIQDKFSFKSVALSAIAGGISGGLEGAGLLQGDTFGVGFVRGAVSNAAMQGIGVATGLQHKFSFAGVAAAGIVQGVGGLMAEHATFSLGAGDFIDNISNGLVSGMAAGIAGAATRSLIEGSNFGDNILAVLPDVIAATIGSALANEFIQGDDAYIGNERAGRLGMQVADAEGRVGRFIDHLVVTGDKIKENTKAAINWIATRPEENLRRLVGDRAADSILVPFEFQYSFSKTILEDGYDVLYGMGYNALHPGEFYGNLWDLWVSGAKGWEGVFNQLDAHGFQLVGLAAEELYGQAVARYVDGYNGGYLSSLLGHDSAKLAEIVAAAFMPAGRGLLSTSRVGALTEGVPTKLFADGSFSVVDWTGYPEGLPKPSGPFHLLEGSEYESARNAANNANRAMHIADPTLDGLQIHEIHPVKFGGSPTNPLNKIPLTPQQHAPATTWWKQLQRDITK